MATLATSREKKRIKVSIVTVRRVVQAGFVGFALFVGARHLWAGSGPLGAPSFDAYCPFGGVETLFQYIVSGTFVRKLHPSNLVVLAATLATALLMGRAFCGWICPLGAVQEWLARLAQRLTGGRRAWLPIKVPQILDRPLRYLKFGVLGWVLWSSISAIVPPLEPFCPYKVLFHFELESALAWSVFSIMIVGSLLVERFWCRYLCPLGAILSIFNKISPVRVHTGPACVDCGRCSATCGMGIEERIENIRSLECIRCFDCIDTCKKPEAIDILIA